ncbi:MAG: DNA adenine methylase [Cytophagales bacterium]|nr:DNA adenine methylase [Cytophagales bacterium]
MVGLILSLIPEHKLYCEPFVGGAAVFFAKEKSKIEVINDLNGEVVNFYQVCKTDFNKLEKLIQATPHSRKIHRETMEILKNPKNQSKIKRAWAFWVQTNMSYSSVIFGGYAYERKGNGTLRKFVNKKLRFTKDIANRLDMVSIECNDALQVIKSRDTNDSFFYLDPPYFNSDMGHYKGYTQKDFTNLLDLLSGIKGQFLLSSYPSEVLTKYTRKNKWAFHSMQQYVSVPDKKKTKTEVLTANYDIHALLENNPKKVASYNLTGIGTRQLQMKARSLKLRLQLQ